MLNRIFLLVCIVFNVSISLAKAHQVHAEGFEIKGRLTTFEHIRKVYLVEASVEDAKIIDSAVISNKGEFGFKGNSTMPHFYFVCTDSMPMLPVPLYINEGIKVQLVIDPYNLKTPYTIVGDKSNDDIQSFYIKNIELENSASSPEKHTQAFQTYILGRENSVGALFSALYLLPPNLNEIADFIEKHESFYVTIDQKYFEQYGKVPLFAEVHQFLLDRSKSPTAIGKVMENFTLNNTKGKPVSLTDFKGKYILVDFWASWCRPCREENPNLVQAYGKFHHKQFEILGVSLDAKKGPWKTAVLSDGLEWPQVCELVETSSLAAKFEFSSIPFNVLLDKDGKIIAKNLRGAQLEEKLKEVLGE